MNKFFLLFLFTIVVLSNTYHDQQTFDLQEVHPSAHPAELYYSHTIRNNQVESQFFIPAYSYVTRMYPQLAYRPFAHEMNVARTMGARVTK